jgi:cytochrome c biogenesis protein CcmG/thiol:disulfide interchange protein DsbE
VRLRRLSVGAVLIWQVLSLLPAGGQAPDSTPPGDLLVNRPAPAFTRKDLDGRPITLAKYRGKVVLLNFWATWCGPCLVEMPQFAQWQRERPNLEVIGVSMDDAPGPVLRARRKFGLPYPVVMGDAKLGRLYGGVYGLPVTLLIDKQGIVRARHRGAENLPQLHAEMLHLLSQ